MHKCIHIPAIVLLFQTLPAFSQVVYTDLYPTTSYYHLKGKVKSCHSKEFGLQNNSQALSPTSSDIENLTFLPSGFIDEIVSYTNGTAFQKTKYNRTNPIYVEIAKEYLLGNEITFDAIIFDSAGSIKEYFQEFIKGGSGFKNNDFYVKKCFLSQKFYNNNYGKPDSIMAYENKKIFHSKSIFKYNNDGLPTEELLILNDPLGSRLINFQYDSKKKLIEERTRYIHPENKQSEISIYIYDLKGNITEKTVILYSDEEFKTIDTKTIYQYTYEYDAQGNWIKSTNKENGKIDSITIRTISYY